MTHITETARDWLARGEPLVLAKITSQQGATPRTAGTQMLVDRGGQGFGTIGGGLLEARVMRRCAEVLDRGTARFERFDLGHADVASMDMICGGDLEILYVPVLATAENVALFDRWQRLLAAGEEGVLVFALRRAGEQVEQLAYGLVEADGRLHGSLPLSQAAIGRLLRIGRTADAMVVTEADDYQIILEPIRTPRSAYLVGAGHVAQPTAHLAALAGFRVLVMDDRDAFANRQRFPDAHQVQVLENFEHPFENLSVDAGSFIVILTRGHLYDKVVLARALATPAGYIGMIGSRRKRDAIFHRLRLEGFGDDDFKRVRSPVGLDIGAETPAEIAVSIVAEMIAARRGKTG